MFGYDEVIYTYCLASRLFLTKFVSSPDVTSSLLSAQNAVSVIVSLLSPTTTWSIGSRECALSV